MNREESNFEDLREGRSRRKTVITGIIKCYICGTSDRQLFRTTPKEKGKKRRYKIVKNKSYICIDCKGK